MFVCLISAAEGDSGYSPPPTMPNVPPMPDLPPLNITGIFAVEADEEVSQLVTIWDDKYVESVGIDSWKCLLCNKLFKPKHTTRAVAHMTKEKNLGIAICPAVVSKEHAQRCTNLFHHTVNKAMNRKRSQQTVLNTAEAGCCCFFCLPKETQNSYCSILSLQHSF